jgi:branched-subunit amino acid aminotransferase/4-amino-4-deoxychorismate lyase
MIFDLQEKNRDENGAFKIIVTGGFSTTLDAVQGESNFIIMNVPWRKPSQESFDKGVNLISYDYLRHDPEIKTLNYFNTLKLRQKLKEYSAVDVLFHNDYLSEVSRANVFLVKGDNIFTPASNILKGITRNQILSLIEGIHIEDIPFASLYEYDEMFITSTTRDITPVVSVDGKIIGKGEPGKVTKEIMRAFDV